MSTSPQKSINGILRNNCRERLFVPPLQWTDRHLQLLRCFFTEKAEQVGLPHSSCLARCCDDASTDKERQKVIHAAKMLARDCNPVVMRIEIECLLEYQDSLLKCSRLVDFLPSVWRFAALPGS